MQTGLSPSDLMVHESMQNLRRLVKVIEDYSRSMERHFGLTGPQLWALWELGRNGPMALKDLASQMQLEPSTLVGVVDRLIGKELVQRTQDPLDRRRVSLCPSPKGAELLRQAPHPAQGYLLQGLRRMEPEQLMEVHRSLQVLVKVMEAEHLNPRFFFSEE